MCDVDVSLMQSALLNVCSVECEEEARIFAEGFGRARDDWNSRMKKRAPTP